MTIKNSYKINLDYIITISRFIFFLYPSENDEIIGITDVVEYIEKFKLNDNKYKLDRVFYITDLDQ